MCLEIIVFTPTSPHPSRGRKSFIKFPLKGKMNEAPLKGGE